MCAQPSRRRSASPVGDVGQDISPSRQQLALAAASTCSNRYALTGTRYALLSDRSRQLARFTPPSPSRHSLRRTLVRCASQRPAPLLLRRASTRFLHIAATDAIGTLVPPGAPPWCSCLTPGLRSIPSSPSYRMLNGGGDGHVPQTSQGSNRKDPPHSRQPRRAGAHQNPDPLPGDAGGSGPHQRSVASIGNVRNRIMAPLCDVGTFWSTPAWHTVRTERLAHSPRIRTSRHPSGLDRRNFCPLG